MATKTTANNESTAGEGTANSANTASENNAINERTANAIAAGNTGNSASENTSGGGASENTSDIPLIKADNLAFSYSEESPLLANISFAIRRGEKVAIIGDSGVGKTTLFHLLLNLYPVSRGSLSLNGVPYAKADVLEHITANTQKNYIFNLGLRANFQKLVPNITDEAILRSLHLAQLNPVVAKIGLDKELGINGKALSGGERIRLLTALALASDREIILLDEPTAGLDRPTAKRMLSAILDEYSEKTIILITHDSFAADYMERVIKL